MYKRLHNFLQRPEPFEKTTTKELWTRPHLANQMLQFHLDETGDVASRNHASIATIANWIDSGIELSGKKLCDLGCGPGLYAERFHEAGAVVTGFDFSCTSIRYARQRAQTQGRSIEYVEADYLHDALPVDCDVVTLIYFDYCALSPESRKVLLNKIRAALIPGGYFVFDVLGPAAMAGKVENVVVEEGLMNSFWSDSDYIGFQQSLIYPEMLLSLDHYLIVEKAESWEVYNWLQHFNTEAITAELDEAGFDIVTVAGSLNGEKIEPNPETIGIIASKR